MVIVCLYHYTLFAWQILWFFILLYLGLLVSRLKTKANTLLSAFPFISWTVVIFWCYTRSHPSPVQMWKVKNWLEYFILLSRSCMLVVMNMCFYELGDPLPSGLVFNQQCYGSRCPETHPYTLTQRCLKLTYTCWMVLDTSMSKWPKQFPILITSWVS